MASYDFPNLAVALQASKDWTEQGFTFIKSGGVEEFYSWARLHREATQRAAHLRKLGMKKGDRLAMVMPDGDDFVPTFFGAVWAGIVPVPVYPPHAFGKQDAYMDLLAAILARAEPSFLAVSSKVGPAIESATRRVKSLQGVITCEQLRAPVPRGADDTMAQLSPQDTALLQFTSGSTAAPKGIEVTHDSLRANAWAIMREGLQSNCDTDHGVSWLPLHHDMGLIGFVISPMFHKVPVTFIPTSSFVRNATIWLDTITRKKATISFAPNFAYALAARRVKPEMLKRWDLSSMRAFGCGAEPINADTLRGFASTFSGAGLNPRAMLPCYGMAEATLAISFAATEAPLATDIIERRTYQSAGRAVAAHLPNISSRETLEFVCCGKTFAGHEVGAFDEAGALQPDRCAGEIRVRGPSVAKCYFRDPQATALTFENGWLHTGDLGYLDNGNLYITGRQKDLIIVNGRNHDPQRIEWLADEVTDVRRGSTVAFSRPGAASEELVLVVESRTREPESVKAMLKQIINEQYQLNPADVVIVAPGSLPKTSSGKLQRQKARAQYLAGILEESGVREAIKQ